MIPPYRTAAHTARVLFLMFPASSAHHRRAHRSPNRSTQQPATAIRRATFPCLGLTRIGFVRALTRAMVNGGLVELAAR